MKAPNLCHICRIDQSNGIGPSGLPMVTKFLQVLPSSHLFYEAGNWHDLLYHWGVTEHDRERADYVFLDLMLQAIKNGCKWYSKPWYKLSAYRNFWFVRKFGYRFFNYHGCK